MESIILIIVVIAVCVTVLLAIRKRIQRAKANIRSVLGDTEKLKYLISHSKELAERHAAERKSLCNMTSLMLPLIQKDFPGFGWEKYRAEVNRHVKEYITDKLKGEKPVIHRTEISDYRFRDGAYTIDAQTSAGYRENTKKIEKRYITQIAYVQDYQKVPRGITGIGLTCPNCGAPVKMSGSKYCEYCGTGIREASLRVWQILETREY